MQRYNPPGTSNQAYCLGCQRQIRKVQELMDERYLNHVAVTLEKRKSEEKIRSLEKQLNIEKVQMKNMRKLLDNGLLGPKKIGAEAGETKELSTEETLRQQVEELKQANEEMMKELESMKETVQEPPAALPFEEWKTAIEQKCEEQVEKIKSIAVEQHELATYFQAEFEKKDTEVVKYTKGMGNLKVTIKRLREKIEELENKKEPVGDTEDSETGRNDRKRFREADDVDEDEETSPQACCSSKIA